MNNLTDTTSEAQRIQDDVYRRMSPQRKWEIVGQMYRMGWSLFEAGVRRDNPSVTEQELVDLWMQRTLEPSLYAEVRNHRDGLAG